ncbi:hypothetical protein HRTV-2_gp100 [Halorubrum virus HRTV-2]|nr:hypothetical protein HRTV-2_gp100 [Halorubrum virus HRTV-2]
MPERKLDEVERRINELERDHGLVSYKQVIDIIEDVRDDRPVDAGDISLETERRRRFGPDF